MARTLWLHVVTLMLVSPQGWSSGYNQYYKDEYDYYYESGDKVVPHFLARSQSFTVEVGQSVILPCDVENMGGNKLIIKKIPANGKNERLLSVASEKVTRDHRISIDGPRLTISNVRPRDAGVFVCQFDLEPPVQLRHTLNVHYPPTIRALGKPEQHVAKGKTVTLECLAEGNPEPVVRWSRQEGPLPSGERSQQGRSLTIEGVDRHVEGTYLCTADNGIGEPAAASMSITVEYPPEVSTEKDIVRTGEGDHVELVCVVHGRPIPEVIWTKDGHSLPDTIMDTKLVLPHHRQQPKNYAYVSHARHTHTAHRHILTINSVAEADFGTYICIAENVHGRKEAVIQMTGLPKPPLIKSSHNGGESTMYTLTWETESYYPITEFLIKYRKTDLSVWQKNHNPLMASSWKNVSHVVVNPAVQTESTHHVLQFTLMNLEVDTDYVTVVRVRNKYGWSAESENFSFATKKAGRGDPMIPIASRDGVTQAPNPMVPMHNPALVVLESTSSVAGLAMKTSLVFILSILLQIIV